MRLPRIISQQYMTLCDLISFCTKCEAVGRSLVAIFAARSAAGQDWESLFFGRGIACELASKVQRMKKIMPTRHCIGSGLP